MYRSGLDAKIETEIAANEGGIVCSDRRARLKSCITQKRAGDLGNHRQRLRDWPIPNSDYTTPTTTTRRTTSTYVGAGGIRSRRHHITDFKNSMLCACDNIEQRNPLVGLLSRRTSLGPMEILFAKACLEECMSLVGAVKQIRRTG
jgi:hypothetical protein